MKKYVTIYFLLTSISGVFAQISKLDPYHAILQKDTIVTEYVIFDYFRQEYDSMVYCVGGYLMPSDSISFKSQNEYRIEVVTPNNGYLNIYFKNKLLYQYSLYNNEVCGVGSCYYPFTSDVSVQGQFVKGKLDGLVFVQNEKGKMIESMKYRNGKYVKHVFHWLSLSKRALRYRSKKRSDNPLRGDEEIIR